MNFVQFYSCLIFATTSNSFNLHLNSLRQKFACRQLNCLSSNGNESLQAALENARKSASSRLSPGAGLLTADEQAEAAYGDLINTTMDQRGITELSVKELEHLNRGGQMWEEGSKTRSRKWGILGDLQNLFTALSGGAHIDNVESKPF